MSPQGTTLSSEIARRVRLVIFDVDGVLTDAGVYVGTTASGETVELKRFDIQDGLGMKLLQRAGLEVAIVSGRVSPATTLRARELGIDCYQDDEALKLVAVREIMAATGVAWDEIAMLGDDIPDVPVLRLVGLPAAVANAVPAVVELAVWRSERRGGQGAAREFCEALLRARGQLDAAVQQYVDERSGS